MPILASSPAATSRGARRPRGRAGRGTVALPLLAVILSLLPVGSSAAADDPRSRLAETRTQIEQTLADLDDLESRTDRSQAQLAAAEVKVAELEAALNDALAALESQRARVARSVARVAAAEAETARISSSLNTRARRAFMGHAPAVIQLVSARGELDDTLDSVTVLDRLAARDGASLEAMAAARTAAAAATQRLQEEQAILVDVHAQREGLLAAAESAMDQHAAVLAGLEREQERLLARQEQLEDESDDLEAIIVAEQAAAAKAEEAARAAEEAARQPAPRGDSGGSDAPAPAPAPPPPAPSGGCYAWPARGPVTSEFGPRWGRMHAGIDIDGSTGDALSAAEAGVVIFAGWQGGYGQLTLIRHGDGVVTAYAHQSRLGVSKGQTVARGQVIGAMGTTGNVTGSHLHFETRVNGGAVNPRRYLC